MTHFLPSSPRELSVVAEEQRESEDTHVTSENSDSMSLSGWSPPPFVIAAHTHHTHTVLSGGTPAGLFADSMRYSHTALSVGTHVGLFTNSGMWYRWHSV